MGPRCLIFHFGLYAYLTGRLWLSPSGRELLEFARLIMRFRYFTQRVYNDLEPLRSKIEALKTEISELRKLLHLYSAGYRYRGETSGGLLSSPQVRSDFLARRVEQLEKDLAALYSREALYLNILKPSLSD